MNIYFRITAYHPGLDISFIIDSVNQYDEIWKFSAALVAKKCKILEVSHFNQMSAGNILQVFPNKDNYILRACMKSRVQKENGVININGRYYTPKAGTSTFV